MHHQVRRWTDPHLNLSQVIQDWPEIRDGLAESKRQRVTQVVRAFGL
jgi:hypothetical protein